MEEEDDIFRNPKDRSTSSLRISEPTRRRSHHQRGVSHRRRSHSRNTHRRSASQDSIRNLDDSNFVFQQPAFDPDVFRQQTLPQTAIGPDRRGWNTQMAVYVKRMGQRGGGYKWMHGQASRYYTKRFQFIGITSIIVNAVATAGNIPYVANCQETLDWIKIVAIILGFLVTVVMAFQQFKDYGARSSNHVTGEANYAALYDHIQQQLRKNSRDRQDANDYVEWISKELNDLKAASPLIPPGILTQYRTIIAGQNIADPEGIDEIIIKRDSPERTNVMQAQQQTKELVEVVVEKQHIPRSGRLVVTYNDDAPSQKKTISERDRIALERWNDH